MRGTQFAQLTAFVAVAEHSSFTKAAAQLGIATPTLSQTIRSLEEQFGVRLLDRTTRSVALTEAGAELLRQLSPALAGVDKAVDAIDAFRDKPAGGLRLAVHPVAAVAIVGPSIAHFSAQYPEIRIEIRVDEEPKDIVSARFDAGIHPADGVAQDMVVVPIAGKIGVSTVASPDYLARNVPLSAPDDLKQHNCIRYCASGNETRQTWKFSNADEHIEVNVAGSLNVNNLNLALRAGLDGVGIVQLPEILVAPFIADGRLVPVLADWSAQWTDFVLFYSSRRHVPLKLRTLVDFLRQETTSTLGPEEARSFIARPRFASSADRPRRVAHRTRPSVRQVVADGATIAATKSSASLRSPATQRSGAECI